ncbi:MAG: hypothetical protein IRZ31_02670 [Thermogemmatispora sp.]|uniref:hypothetical protein n=1 Tax=Thermogemmatispora sp. TaxID=1968838 RepID=UPI002623D697|nr:hypothetical protein [Thermogemmatispora sp.]MBX5455781.1 hypothetical protein [Thermogemmatispora sp.]
MSIFLFILLSLLVYIAALVALVRATGRLRYYRFDEAGFLGMAALDIVAGILLFSAVATPLVLLTGSTVESVEGRVLAFLLLLGIILVSGAAAWRSLGWSPSSQTLSRLLGGIYCLLLALAALVCMVLIFLPGR